jgi:hypothetical protein
MIMQQQTAHGLQAGDHRPTVNRRPFDTTTARVERLLRDNAPRLARGLGWFSIGLGLAEVVAPCGMAKLTGINGHSSLVRLFGLREIASGVGILSRRKTGAWLWARVAGDAMDLAVLGAAMASRHANRTRLLVSSAAVGGVALADVLCAQQEGCG